MTQAAIDKLMERSGEEGNEMPPLKPHEARLIPFPTPPLQELTRRYGGKVTSQNNNGCFDSYKHFSLYFTDLKGKHSAEDIQATVEELFGIRNRAMRTYGCRVGTVGLTYDFEHSEKSGREKTRYRLCLDNACE
ncbi:MAG: hypothetical protein AB1668_05845 [Nanoarchaeota archaeon]